MVSGRVYFKGRSRGERHRNITLLKINIESVLKNKVIMHIQILRKQQQQRLIERAKTKEEITKQFKEITPKIAERPLYVRSRYGKNTMEELEF